ncbi:MAG: hypothetical protein IJU04_01685, partial [Ruminococcus sp.]|nr:hypothetical protein [Ruminococcus sp.]
MEPDITNPDDLFKLLSIANQAGGLTPNKAKDIVYEAVGEVAEPFPEEWGELPLALQKQQGSGSGVEAPLMMQLRNQITKAEKNHDDEIVAVMKEVKNLLQSSENSGIIKTDWNEEDHPRGEHGKFTSGGGSYSDGETDYGEKYGY